MFQTTREIVLTFDDFADYFPFDYPESLVRGVARRDIEPGDPLVMKRRAWVQAYADHPPSTTDDFTSTIHFEDSAVTHKYVGEQPLSERIQAWWRRTFGK